MPTVQDRSETLILIAEKLTELAVELRNLAGAIGDSASHSPDSEATYRQDLRRHFSNGASVDLSETEAEIFKMLLDRRGLLVTKAELCEALGLDQRTQAKNLKAYVFRLKAKLGRLGDPDLNIRSVRGAGYTIEVADAS